MKTLLEEVIGSEVEKRALEIALSGGHSMVILYNTGSFAPTLMDVGRRASIYKIFLFIMPNHTEQSQGN